MGLRSSRAGIGGVTGGKTLAPMVCAVAYHQGMSLFGNLTRRCGCLVLLLKSDFVGLACFQLPDGRVKDRDSITPIFHELHALFAIEHSPASHLATVFGKMLIQRDARPVHDTATVIDDAFQFLILRVGRDSCLGIKSRERIRVVLRRFVAFENKAQFFVTQHDS
jgi:hypothetical protein